MSDKTILITGAAGFIGFHLCRELEKQFEIIGIDSLEPGQTASVQRARQMNRIVQADISGDFITGFTKPHIVIHLAGETGIAGSETHPERYFRNNVAATFNVLEQCRKNNIRFLIYASSSSVYSADQAVMNESSSTEKQLSFYGTTKKMTETMVGNYCRQYGITAIGLRFFTVYGSWTRPDMAAYKFMRSIDRGEPVTIYNNGDVCRDFTHVSDIVTSIRLLTEKIVREPSGFHRIFNIGYGSPVSVKEYACLIATGLEKELIFQNKPLPSNELTSTHSDTSALEDYIHYKPQCPVEQGIPEMIRWFRSENYE